MKKTVIISCLFFVGFLTSQTIYSQSKKSDSTLINELISKKRSFNKEFGYGFRIQLYNGFETEAKKTETKFKINFPEIKTYLLYRQPEWKIQVGFYKTKLEADRALLDLKRKYGSAIVIPLGK
jgi:hypothetical protein